VLLIFALVLAMVLAQLNHSIALHPMEKKMLCFRSSEDVNQKLLSLPTSPVFLILVQTKLKWNVIIRKSLKDFSLKYGY